MFFTDTLFSFQTSFVGLDIFTGKKLQYVVSSTHNVEVPNVRKQEYKVPTFSKFLPHVLGTKRTLTWHGVKLASPNVRCCSPVLNANLNCGEGRRKPLDKGLTERVTPTQLFWAFTGGAFTVEQLTFSIDIGHFTSAHSRDIISDKNWPI